MDLFLKDSVAVVIGGAQGIGLAVAKELAREGARVAVVDLDVAAEEVATNLKSECGVDSIGVVADVTEAQAMSHVAKHVDAQLGPCEHVICTAGIGSGKFGFPFWNLEPSDWDRVVKVNLIGTVNVAHAFTPGFVERRRGDFLFFSSVAGQIGSQTDPPYSAAKAGVINFTQCAAKDLAPYRVRVNCICPGMVKTKINRSVWESLKAQDPAAAGASYEEWADAKVRQVVPLGRWQEPEDVAAMCAFLASPRAQAVTGQTINVDGGFVMH